MTCVKAKSTMLLKLGSFETSTKYEKVPFENSEFVMDCRPVPLAWT